MKYIVCGVNLAAGTKENDSPQLSQYFELGWEVVGSRIDAISKKNSGLIDVNNTTIVTIEDRMFMYQKLFPHVMSSNKFLDLRKRTILLVDDWPSYKTNSSDKTSASFSFLKGDQHCSADGRYINHDRDFEDIFNGYDLDQKYSNSNFSEPCIVMGYRSRSHLSHKNSKGDELKIAKAMVKRGLVKDKNVFVVGNGNDVVEFCKYNKFTHIQKLQSFVSILKNENCICHIAPATGTTLLSFHSAQCPILLVDPHGAAKLGSLNAVLGGKPSQFFQGGIRWLKGALQVNNFIINLEKEVDTMISKKAGNINK